MCDSIEAKKKYLRRYLDAAIKIRCLEEDLRVELSTYALRAQSYDDMPHASGSNGADLANMAVKFDEMMAEIRREVARQYAIKEEIIKRLNHMHNEREETVLYYRYIMGKKWEDVAKIMHYDISTVFLIHGSALQHF